MQTNFSESQLANPEMAASEAIIRKCVHCGFCTATCPTFVLLGDELDSPRGRIYLIKDMLENERDPVRDVVKHVDRCLSCLSCMTTCPSGVNYMHLVDQARAYIERRYKRPFIERIVRTALILTLPNPKRFRMALLLARLVKPIEPIMRRVKVLNSVSAMLRLAPSDLPNPPSNEKSLVQNPRGRVAILQGCAEPVLRPEIRAATVRMINRMGFDVIFASGEVCCGALVHHMGREEASRHAARTNIDAWMAEIRGAGLDAIIITASGCGTTIKDYGYMLRNDPAYANKAVQIAGLAKDISEWLEEVGVPEGNGRGLNVAYHAACSLQHGQRITMPPKNILSNIGFALHLPDEAHLCCGSAGTYNILQPQIAGQLGDRKVAQLERLKPDVIATGNIGCAVQITQRTDVPVLHVVELMDWATGGPVPAPLSALLDGR